MTSCCGALRSASVLLFALLVVACGPTGGRPQPDAGGGIVTDSATVDSPQCYAQCSDDERAVVDCNGDVIATCDPAQVCDVTTSTCTDACQAAESHKRSVGCDYFATDMDVSQPTYCFAAFVANTWSSPAKIEVEYQGAPLDVASFTRIPVGSGPALTYDAYDPNVGLMPGEVAVLFLSGDTGDVPLCPVAPAVTSAGIFGTGIADAFRIKTDVPVVAYQINPYGGGSVAITGGSLLIPTSAWDTEYIAVNVSPKDPGVSSNLPSLNILAREDATTVTLVPNVDVTEGGGIPAGTAGTPMKLVLDKGQYVQISQAAELTGSIVTADKPIGFMAGQRCMNMPIGVHFCDHGEQMVPPVQALGHRYVGVMYRPRVAEETKTFWRLVGAVDGTQLTWSANVGGPLTLDRGESVIFETGTPFVVESQGSEYPFLLFTYMTSSQYVKGGYGDPDFVLGVPPEQYLNHYVFFTDPTYPETNLVVVRSRQNGSFADVHLDCAGALTGWQPVGQDFEYTRVDLSTGDFQGVGTCSTGRREISSTAPFGLWVWGWGTPMTETFTVNVSYGYPGGMNVQRINNVILL